jgi:DNA-binding response OmpR family regulator
VSPLSILLVDDDPNVRALLRLTLPAGEAEVREGSGVADALEEIEREMPDLVLLDWVMPDGTGAKVLEELKRRRGDLPVIVLTAELDAKTKTTAERLGADAFLTKPFSPLELLGEIERLLPKEAL